MQKNVLVHLHNLPVPNEAETRAIGAAFFPAHRFDTDPLEDVTDVVISANPDIAAIIRDDYGVFTTNHYFQNLSERETDITTDGLRAGYEFIVGTFTMVRFLRCSGLTRIEEYLHLAVQNPGEIPVQTPHEYMRVRDFLHGLAYVEPVNELQQSPNPDVTAAKLRDQYFRVATSMRGFYNDLVQEELVKSKNMRESGLYVRTFKRGVANALVMYQQTYEESQLQPLDFAASQTNE